MFVFDIVLYFQTCLSNISFLLIDDDQTYKDSLNFLYSSKHDISII